MFIKPLLTLETIHPALFIVSFSHTVYSYTYFDLQYNNYKLELQLQ